MIELQMKEKEFWIEFQFYFLVFYLSNLQLQKPNSQNKLASLEVTIVWNYVWPTDWCKV